MYVGNKRVYGLIMCSLVSSYHSNRTLGHQICTKADLFASYSAISYLSSYSAFSLAYLSANKVY